MATFDPTKLKFSLWVRERSALSEYLELVANNPAFMQYKEIVQHGSKRGESLYMHVVNGVMLLDALRPALSLSGFET